MTSTVTKVVAVNFTQNGAETVTRDMKKMGAAAKGTGKEVSAFQKTLLQVGGFVAITAALKQATTAALAFGTAMAEVSTLLPDDKEMAVLTKGVKELSLAFGKAPAEEAKALYQIISAGAANATEAMNTLNVANKLAIGGVTDVESAADALTGTMNAYGDSVSGATEVADKFFATVRLGKTTITELNASIGLVAPVASEMGVSLTAVLAATATLTKANVKTSISMRGLRQVMISVNKPTSEAAALAKKIELSFSGAALKAQGFAKFLESVKKATKGSQEQLGILFGNVEALLPVMKLTGNAAEDFAKNLDEINNSGGSIETAFQKMADTAEFKLDRAFTKVSLVMISIGDTINIILAPAAEFLADNFDVLAISVLGLTAALVAVNFTSIIAGLTAATAATIAWTTALLLNPIVAIAVGVTAAAIAVKKLNDSFFIVDVTWNVFINNVKWGWNVVVIGAQTAINWIQEFIQTFRNGMMDASILVEEGKLKWEQAFGSDEGAAAVLTKLNQLKQAQNEYNLSVETNREERNENIEKLRQENIALEALIETDARRFLQRREGAIEEDAPAGGGGTNTNKSDADRALAAAEAQKLLNEALERGLSLTKELRTPIEIYREDVAEITELLKQGAISQETFNRALQKYDKELSGANKQSEAFVGTIESIIDGSTTAADIFKQSAKIIIRALLDMTIEANSTKEAFASLGGIMGGGSSSAAIGQAIGSIAASFLPGAGGATASTGITVQQAQASGTLLIANGGIHQNGRMEYFANGGVVQNISSFPLAGGKTGVMSEVSPEAIMPLTRGAGGKLGVNATGAGTKVFVNVIDQRKGGEEAQVEESQNADGTRRVSILIRDEVKKGFNEGNFDPEMRMFGVARGGARRN